MAIRNDITIDWSVSPRIITVDSPSVDITMQDLYDTLRTREQDQIDETFIIAGAGKEPLGGGVLVGLTLTLNNALLEFEARTGPSYTLCTVGGGNLVAVDVNGDPVVSPINPTAFVTIVQANSSSATLQELKAIQFSSFNGGVTIDIGNISGRSVSGTDFPIGTLESPSNNLYDAHLIALENGFNKIFVIGNVTLDNTTSWERHEFVGESALKTAITILSEANVLNCECYEASISGTLDGNSHIERSVISNLFFVDGYLYNCAIGPAIITLGTSTVSNIFECYSTVPGALTPIIDMNGTGQLALRGYKGGILLKNYNGTGGHSVDLSSGQIVLDNTITSGTFIIRGVGKLVDTNGNHIRTGTWNGGVTIINELVNNEEIKEAVWNANLSEFPTKGTAGYILEKTEYLKRSVYVDPELVANGNGSSGSPFNNLTDAIDFAEAHSLRELIALTEITLDRNLKNFIITGIGTPVINCGGFDLKGSEFRHCTMRGVYVDAITVQESVLDNGFYLNGFFENCAIGGTITCVDGSNVLLKDCSGLTDQIISMNGAGSSTLIISGHSGNLTIKDSNNALDNLNIGMSEGIVTIDATCTDGNITVTGNSKLINNSAILGFDSSALVQPQDLVDVLKLTGNKVTKSGDIITIYEKDGTTVWKQIDLSNGGRVDV